MARPRNISKQTRAALSALLERPSDWHYGYDLMERTGLASGTLYPMLIRLCNQGNLEAKWLPSSQEGRPPRHAYRLTPSGVKLARNIPKPADHGSEHIQGLVV